MEIKQQFKNAIETCSNDDYDGVETISGICETIAHDFAIGFLKFANKNYRFSKGHYFMLM